MDLQRDQVEEQVRLFFLWIPPNAHHHHLSSRTRGVHTHFFLPVSISLVCSPPPCPLPSAPSRRPPPPPPSASSLPLRAVLCASSPPFLCRDASLLALKSLCKFLRCPFYRRSFYEHAEGVATLKHIFRMDTASNIQAQYLAAYCAWVISFDPHVADRLENDVRAPFALILFGRQQPHTHCNARRFLRYTL